MRPTAVLSYPKFPVAEHLSIQIVHANNEVLSFEMKNTLFSLFFFRNQLSERLILSVQSDPNISANFTSIKRARLADGLLAEQTTRFPIELKF